MLKALKQRFMPEKEEEKEDLMESLRATKAALQRAFDGFNRATDGDLIESYVFEINALQRRYDYLLKLVRAQEIPA